MGENPIVTEDSVSKATPSEEKARDGEPHSVDNREEHTAENAGGDSEVIEREEKEENDTGTKSSNNLLQISRKYDDLVDFGGLMTVLRHSSEIINSHNDRIIKLEDKVERSQGVISGIKNLGETTNRVEQLIKRTKSMIEASERGQKVERIRIQGEMEDLASKITYISGRVTQSLALSKSNADDISRLEKIMEQKADAEKVDALSNKVKLCASNVDIALIEKTLGKMAAKADLVAISKALEESVKLDDLRNREDRLTARFSDMIDDLRNKVLLSASKAEVDLLEKRTVLALQSGSSIEAVVEEHKTYFDRIFDQLDTIQETLEEIPNETALKEIQAASEDLIENKLKATSVETKSLQAQIEAISNSVSANNKSIENITKSLELNNMKFDEKVSSTEFQEVIEEFETKYPSKEILGDVVDPIIMKLNQLVAKIVDLDEVMQQKGDSSLGSENREHIEEIYAILRAQERKTAKQVRENENDMFPIFKEAPEGQNLRKSQRRSSTSITPLSYPSPEKDGLTRRGSVIRRRASSSSSVAMINPDYEEKFNSIIEEQANTKLELKQLRDSINEMTTLLHTRHANYDFSALQTNERSSMISKAIEENASNIFFDNPKPPKDTIEKVSSGPKISPPDLQDSKMPKEGPSPRKIVYTTPHDKQNWDNEEKQRWLVENRMGDSPSIDRDNISELPSIDH